MRSIFQTPDNSALVIANPSTHTYIVQLVGKISQIKYKSALSKVLEDARQTKYCKVLLNIKDLKNTPDVGKRWLATRFIPKLHKQNKRIVLAVIPPKNTLDKANFSLITTIAKTLGINIRLKVFSSVIVAENWLSKVPNLKPKARKKASTHREEVPDFLQDMDLESVLEKDTEEKPQKKRSRFKVKFEFDKKGNVQGKSKTENLKNKAKTFSFGRWVKSFTEPSVRLQKHRKAKKPKENKQEEPE